MLSYFFVTYFFINYFNVVVVCLHMQLLIFLSLPLHQHSLQMAPNAPRQAVTVKDISRDFIHIIEGINSIEIANEGMSSHLCNASFTNYQFSLLLQSGN